MATRATKSGINADMKKKLDAKVKESEEHQQEAREWLEELVGEKIKGGFFEGLQDGSFLCKALNKLEKDTVKKMYETPATAPFKKMETVGKFIEGCKKYGMAEKDLFVTLDLHELQNRDMVLSTIFSLGRQAQKNGFEGAVLGPKESEAQPQEFDEQKLKEGRNLIGLQMGTNQVAHQGGMTAYGLGRQIA